MSEKKILVVYYSRTGTTRKVAEAVTGLLSCEAEEIVDLKKRDGPMGFAVAVKDATLKKLTMLGTVKNDPGAYDLVVVGTPVWANTMSSAVRTYLAERGERLRAVAFFVTAGGTGIDRTLEHLAEVCGKSPVATLALKAKEVREERYADKVKDFVDQLRG